MESKFSNIGSGVLSYIGSLAFTDLITKVVVLSVVFYITVYRKLRRPKKSRLTREQEDAIIAKWKSDDLVPEVDADHPALSQKYISGKVGKFIEINGVRLKNFSATNFLGFVGDERIEAEAKKIIGKYGVGSCGPRSFYGTVDIHINFEKQLADFLGCEDIALYSYGLPTIASAIPAYSKRGDVIFADKGVNFAIQKGLQASRSRIEWFEHNDISDLERLLIKQEERDRKNPKLASKTRRFIVVEGLYMYSSDICPLPAIMELKWKYKVRVFLDESFSIGVLGATGKGLTEHFGIDITDVDIIAGSLEHSFASTGGFCAGRSYVIDHQRLSGSGYCFSASLPPLLAAAAGKALEIMCDEPHRLEKLRQASSYLSTGLDHALQGTNFICKGNPLSPFHYVYCDADETTVAGNKLDLLIEKMADKGFLLSRMHYLVAEELFEKKPSIRITVQSNFTTDELAEFLSVLRESALEVHAM